MTIQEQMDIAIEHVETHIDQFIVVHSVLLNCVRMLLFVEECGFDQMEHYNMELTEEERQERYSQYEKLTRYMVEEYQREQLAKLERVIAAAIALATMGGLLGQLKAKHGLTNELLEQMTVLAGQEIMLGKDRVRTNQPEGQS